MERNFYIRDEKEIYYPPIERHIDKEHNIVEYKPLKIISEFFVES